MELIPERVEMCLGYIRERQSIWHKREVLKLPPPWTSDEVFQTYRFPNMYREQDKVTKWITDNWREPFNQHEDVWFAMATARFNNWPDTLAKYGSPIPWDKDRFIRTLKARKANGEKVFTGAYVIAAGPGASKIEYVASILDDLWEDREYHRPRGDDTLASFYSRLREQSGLGTFMAAQIVADTKYTQPLSEASDWWEWAAPGPGSLKGMNRLVGRPVSANWHQDEWLGLVNELRVAVWDELRSENIHPEPHAQDAQGFCCEFDKLERTRLGEGRPRSKYEVPS